MDNENEFSRKAAVLLATNSESLGSVDKDSKAMEQFQAALTQALTEAYQEGFEAGMRQRRIIDEFFAPKWPYSQ